MDVDLAIKTRRAYRSFDPLKITENLINDLAESAKLAPSCFNNQPWKYVFVYDPETLKALHTALSKGNEWAYDASMIVAVCSKKELDCAMKDGREYYLFDVGMATAFMVLRATELGLVAHPIAGYDPQKVKEALAIPQDYNVITLVNIGKHSAEIKPSLSEMQAKGEKDRPQRLDNARFVFHNKFTGDI